MLEDDPAADFPLLPEGDPANGWLSFASCFWEERATAVMAATKPPSVASDQCPDPPIPKNRTTVPSAPVL
jgi:hypothetical protein